MGIIIAGVIWAKRQPAEDPFAHVVRILRPSVALVTAETPIQERHHDTFEEVYGTATVVKSNTSHSLLLTDAHVVDKAKHITIRLDDGRKLLARTVAVDPAHDAALMVVDLGSLPEVHLGHATTLEAGAPVGVAGYPIPDAFEDQHLNITLSAYAGRIASIRNTALELDVPIIPGESGGPVFDAQDGSVIGMAESRFDEEPAIGFATPIEQLRAFINHVAL